MTHPFHPLCGRAYEFVARRSNWGEDRVCFHDEHGELKSLPAAWTDVIEPDLFVVVAAGRSPLHVDDLLVLVEMVTRARSAKA